MLKAIMNIVQNILDNYDLTDYCGGTVIETAPLTVQVTESLTVPQSALLLNAGAEFYNGERLNLLKVLGGQRYLVLGEAVE